MATQSAKSRGRRNRAVARNPHAALVDAMIHATGRPTWRNRRRLHQARLAASAAVTVALASLGASEQLVEVA